MMKEICLPEEFVCPIDLKKDANINALVLDIGYKIYKFLENNVSINKEVSNESRLNETRMYEEIERMRGFYMNMLAKSEEDMKTLNQKSVGFLNDEITKYRTICDLNERKVVEREKILAEREQNFIKLINEERMRNKLEVIADGSAKKGEIGEEMIYNWTLELFNAAEITDQSKFTAKCDLRVKINNKLFLMEVKNKVTITKADIDKFIRDISENSSEVHGGLFISINSPSIPNKGDFYLEYINDIPVIYLHVDCKATLKVAIKTLLFLNNKTDSDVLTMLVNNVHNRISSMSINAASLERNLTDSRTSLDSLKREIKLSLESLNDLFECSPEYKFEVSVQKLEFNENEIVLLKSIYASNKKAKMADYAQHLKVSVKYLQDRGGYAKIKQLLS